MEHYYTPAENISGNNLTIGGDEAKHLAKVLRKTPGSEIFVTDGLGHLYKCRIDSLGKSDINCFIIGTEVMANEPEIKLTAYISILKNPDRFEFAVEKLTELGVHAIRPIVTERVISKTKNKTARWQSIALSAMKQSRRSWLPPVSEPVKFADAITNCTGVTKLIAHEKGALPLHVERGPGGEVALFVGPEGGFTDEEVKLAEDNGFNVISLGARKYRSETAAIAAAAMILI